MAPAHMLNLMVHVSAGALAILLGLVILASAKGTPLHRSRYWAASCASRHRFLC